jgi:hypothetical protein
MPVKILVEKSQGRTPLGRTKRRRKDNIKMLLEEMLFKVINLVHVTRNWD